MLRNLDAGVSPRPSPPHTLARGTSPPPPRFFPTDGLLENCKFYFRFFVHNFIFPSTMQGMQVQCYQMLTIFKRSQRSEYTEKSPGLFYFLSGQLNSKYMNALCSHRRGGPRLRGLSQGLWHTVPCVGNVLGIFPGGMNQTSRL